jgi:hypothetical protein
MKQKIYDNLSLQAVRMSRQAYVVAWPVMLGLLLLATVLIGLMTLGVDSAIADGPDQGEIVVQLDDGEVLVSELSFTGPISGLEALALSGLDYGTSYGTVCSIEGVGCPADDCFCACPPPYTDCQYWNYFYWDGSGSQWESHAVGANASVLNDGAVEGWVWGAYGVALPAPPPTATAEIVVRLDDGSERIRQIDFSEPISGVEALALSGLDYEATGGTVCSIEGVGCPADDCFCACPPPYTDCQYWNYLYWDTDSSIWQSYGVGANLSSIGDGAVEGWAWGAFGTTPGQAPEAMAANKALEWLAAEQSAVDGGYGNMAGGVETLFAVGANGEDAATWKQLADSPSLEGYVLAGSTTFVNQEGVAAYGKLAVGLAASEACWPAGISDPAYNAGTGEYSAAPGAQSWAILGKLAMSQTIPAKAVDSLIGQANPDGSWSWLGSGSDVDGTALAVQALVASGESVSSTAVVSGMAYIKSMQNSDGGFPSMSGASNANSTAYAVQAIVAVGQDPSDVAWGAGISNTTPITHLLNLQQADGSFWWTTSTAGDLSLATRQAVPALLKKPFPLKQGNLPACAAAIEVDMQADKYLASIGETINFSYEVTNTGNLELSVTGLDDTLGEVSFERSILAPGAASGGKLSLTVGEANLPGPVNNSVVVTGTPPTGSAVTDSASATVDVAAIVFTKTVGTGTDCAAGWVLNVSPGSEVVYCFQLKNSGTVSFTDHSLIDSELGQLLGPGQAYDLGPGATFSVTRTETITTSVVNTATWIVGSGSVTLTATSAATVYVVLPAQVRHLAPFADDSSSGGAVTALASSGVTIDIKNQAQALQFSGVKFGETTPVFTLADVTTFITITSEATPSLQATLVITPSGGTTQTILVAGDELNSDAPLAVVVTANTTAPPAAGKGKLRITHLATFGNDKAGTAVDLDLAKVGVGPVGTPFPMNGVQYLDTIGYVELMTGTYILTAAPVSAGDALTVTFELAEGDVGTIFLTGNNVYQPLGVAGDGISLAGEVKVYLPIVIKDD